jgi:uncharacterized membrane-anchored protein
MEIQSLDEFVSQLLVDKGITDLEPDIEADLKQEMKTRLEEQINKAAVMQLSEEKASELEQIMDDPDFTEEKLTEFMQNSGVNLAEVALNTMLQFRSLYLDQGE